MDYLTRPVFTLAPDFNRPETAVQDDVSYAKQGEAGIATPWAGADAPQSVFRWRFLLDRAEAHELETFFDSVRGRLQGFWLPLRVDDYPLRQALLSSTTFFEIEPVALADRFSRWPQQYGHLALRSGTSWVLKAIESVSATSSAETLTLTASVGADLPAPTLACRLAYVRFAEAELALDWKSPGVAEATVAFLELPDEYAGPDLQTRPVYLYRATRGSSVWYWTNYPATIEAGGETWRPADITHGTMTLDRDAFPEPFEVSLGTSSAAHPFRSFLTTTAIELTTLEVFETAAPGFSVDLGDPFFKGQIGAPTYRPRGVVVLRTTSPLRVNERRVPRFLLQRRCNHTLFDGSCRVNAATFSEIGTVTAVGSKYVDATEFGDRATAESNAQFFALGRVRIGNEIRLCVSQSGDRLTLNAAFVSASIGDTVTAWAGCDKLLSTCVNKFDNLVNFGGFPDMPYENPQLEALQIPEEKNGGKKG